MYRPAGESSIITGLRWLVACLVSIVLLACNSSDESNHSEDTDTHSIAGDAGVDSGTIKNDDTDTAFGPDSGLIPDAGADTDSEDPGVCVIEDTDPDYTRQIGCRLDYEAIAAPPPTETIPGALSAKTVIDSFYDYNLYFQNSKRYRIHYDFASTHLSIANGMDPISS